MTAAILKALGGMVAKPLWKWIAHRQASRSGLAKLAADTAASVTLSQEETRALRVRNMMNSWTDEYLLIWWTLLATYAAFDAPWGGETAVIRELLNDPVVMTFIGAVFGVRKFLK